MVYGSRNLKEHRKTPCLKEKIQFLDFESEHRKLGSRKLAEVLEKLQPKIFLKMSKNYVNYTSFLFIKKTQDAIVVVNIESH